MRPEDYQRLAEATWKANRVNAEKIAKDLLAKHRLPPAAPILIENLASLLADLQKTSFVHGVVAAYYAMEKADVQ